MSDTRAAFEERHDAEYEALRAEVIRLRAQVASVQYVLRRKWRWGRFNADQFTIRSMVTVADVADALASPLTDRRDADV